MKLFSTVIFIESGSKTHKKSVSENHSNWTNSVTWNAAESTLGYLHRGTCTQEHSDYTKLNLHSSEMGPVWHKAKVWRKRGFQSTGLFFSYICSLGFLSVSECLQTLLHLFFICHWVGSSTPCQQPQDLCSFLMAWFLHGHSGLFQTPSVKTKSSGRCSFAYRGPTVTVRNKLLHIIRHAFPSTQKKEKKRNFSVRKICNLWFKEWE